jgi:hypothetical protein
MNFGRFKKKFAQGQKNAPKRRNFAQSGHTAHQPKKNKKGFFLCVNDVFFFVCEAIPL